MSEPAKKRVVRTGPGEPIEVTIEPAPAVPAPKKPRVVRMDVKR